MQNLIYIFLLCTLLQFSCETKKQREYPDVSNISVDISIVRLDEEIRGIKSIQKMDTFLFENPMFAEFFLGASEYPDRRMVVKRFYDLMEDPGIDSLWMEVDDVYSDLSAIESQFEEAFKHLKYYYPDTKTPKIQTVVSGILNDLYLSDSLIIIGLDYYLGNDGTFIPDIPSYIVKRYQKEYLVPQCMMLMSASYNANNVEDQTALADMIFYGKAYYFTEQMLPGISDTLITGYTTEETENIHEFENVIWAGLLENEALYETSHMIKEKFMGERPKVFEIGQNCPGRIGRWVGYRIVSKYMEKHPDVTLQQLMADPDAKKIFMESNYRPK